MNETLQETSFKTHKNRVFPIYDKYMFFNTKKANSVLQCGVSLWFHLKEHQITKEQKLKLAEMYTCKDRFCPFCNWRRQMKYSKMIYNHISTLEATKKLRYIFLTLTVKNCKLNDLRATIDHMQKSFNEMTRTKKWKDSILGYLRVLEFTKEKNRAGYMHPHFHLLLAVEPSYFDTKQNKYLKKDDFAKMWRKALRVDYEPVVDVRIIKKNKDKNANAAVVAEICKYPLKDIDLSKLTWQEFEILVLQLKNVRNINAGGILKGILKPIANIDDDLINVDLESNDPLWIIIEKILYSLETRNGKLDYYLKKKENL